MSVMQGATPWPVLSSLGKWLRFSSVRARLPLICGVFCLLVLVAPVWAECPAGEGETVPSQPDALLALAKQLGELEFACLEDANYLAWYGAILSALGQVDAATVRLERALMLSPELLAARVEYAVALGRSARWSEAVDLIDQLLADPDLPDALREPLQGYRDYWWARLPGFWASAQLQAGYSSNLNSAPQQRNHSLTFGDQQSVMQLAPSETQRSGAALLLEMAGGYEAQLESGNRLYTTGVLRARHSEVHPETDYMQLDGALNWTGVVNSSRFNRLLGGGLQLLSGKVALGSLRTGAAYEYGFGSCVLRGGADVEWRHYPLNDILDGLAPAVAVAARCELPGYRALQPGMQLRTERDYALGDRAGGDQLRTELALSLRHPLAQGWLDGFTSYQWLRDQTGYSVLLENNSVRTTGKIQLRMDYTLPLDAGWLLVGTYSWAKQDSNLSLFRIKEQSIWIGVRRQW